MVKFTEIAPQVIDTEAKIMHQWMYDHDKDMHPNMKKLSKRAIMIYGDDQYEILRYLYRKVNRHFQSIYPTLEFPGGGVRFIEKSIPANNNEIWEDFQQPCHTQTMVLRRMLIETGFNPDHVVYVTNWIGGVPHQYMKVKINDAWYDVDVWAKDYGVEFGDHWE